eukprot:6198099-Pleurochrysis_carterae.AAC.1
MRPSAGSEPAPCRSRPPRRQALPRRVTRAQTASRMLNDQLNPTGRLSYAAVSRVSSALPHFKAYLSLLQSRGNLHRQVTA